MTSYNTCLLLLWYWCTRCLTVTYGHVFFRGDELNCPSPGDKWITQKQVEWNLPNRAFHTLPPELMLSGSNIPKAGMGIIAKTFIPKYTWLGEYEGEVFQHGDMMSAYSFQVTRGGETHHYIDSCNPDTSNWTRWVNCARTNAEENVKWLYCAGHVIFMARKDIYPGQELLLYYGHAYAKFLGIKYQLPETSNEDDEWDVNTEEW